MQVDITFFRTYLYAYVSLVGFFGLIYTWNQPKNYWKSFPIFLMMIGILDGLGTPIYDNFGNNIGNNYYTLFLIPAQVIYYIWIINKNIVTEKRFYYLSLVVFFLSILVETLFFRDYKGAYFLSLSFTIGNLVLLANILRYFYQLSTSEKILTFFNEKMFWVSLGLLIFWLGSLPFYGIFNYLNTNFPRVFLYYYPFVLVFNYTMYTCFLISFIWGRKS
jgi:hypothetical protein